MFAEDQLERLRTFPDIGRDDLIRYFTLTPADVAFLDPARGRGPADRLRFAVALATLPWLGFVPDEVRAAPAAAARLAERLGLDPAVLAGMTRLVWLTTPAVDATAAAVKTSIEKLVYLRGMDAQRLDLSMLPAERRRFLAAVGRRSTSQALERRDPDRRYPILLALVAQSAADQLDEVVALFDRAVSARESRAKSRTDEELAERARRGEARHLLMDVILPVLADPAIPDQQVGGLLRERIGMGELRAAVSGGWKPLPRDHGRLPRCRRLTCGSSPRDVLAVVGFQGGPGTAALMEAVEVLQELNRQGGRKVPGDAPASFVPTIHAARYLSDPAYRRKIARQLNKGESLHALRRDLRYARQGTITQPRRGPPMPWWAAGS